MECFYPQQHTSHCLDQNNIVRLLMCYLSGPLMILLHSLGLYDLQMMRLSWALKIDTHLILARRKNDRNIHVEWHMSHEIEGWALR